MLDVDNPTIQTMIVEQLPAGTVFRLIGDAEGAYYAVLSASDVGLLVERYVPVNGESVKESTRFLSWAAGPIPILTD